MASQRSPEANGGVLLLRTLRFGGGEDVDRLGAAWSHPPGQLNSLVALERCGTWLLRRLGEIGVEQHVEQRFREWLVAEARAGAARNMLIESRAMTLAHWLTQRGVPFVFLKGMARRLAAERYPAMSARVTTDVDLLLKPRDAERVWTLLREEGEYRLAVDPRVVPEGHYHLPPLAQADGVAVELHTATAREVAPAEAWSRATDCGMLVEREGLRLLVPCATEMLWQAVTHAEIDGSSGYDLRHFHDAAVLLAAAEIDWPTIDQRFDSGEIRDPERMKGWFGAALWLAGISEPPSRAPWPPAFDLERTLRWRYAVRARGGERPRMAERLVDEATRAEAGLRMAQCLEGTPLALRARRRVATTLARGGYFLWRVSGG